MSVHVNHFVDFTGNYIRISTYYGGNGVIKRVAFGLNIPQHELIERFADFFNIDVENVIASAQFDQITAATMEVLESTPHDFPIFYEE